MFFCRIVLFDRFLRSSSLDNHDKTLTYNDKQNNKIRKGTEAKGPRLEGKGPPPSQRQNSQHMDSFSDYQKGIFRRFQRVSPQKFENQINKAITSCFYAVKRRVVYSTRVMLPSAKKDSVPTT